MNTTAALNSVYVRDVPNIDPPIFYSHSSPENGLDRIVLPSGHTAFHIKEFNAVREVLLDKRFVRAPSNEEEAPSVFPTLTPKELLLNTDYPDHARLKSLVSREFSPQGVAVYKQYVQSIIDERLDWLRYQDSRADLYSDFLDHIPATVICKILGIDLQDMKYFRPLSRVVQIASRDDIPGLVNNFDLTYQYLMDLVRGERTSSPDGFIHNMIEKRNSADQPFTDEEFVGVLLGVLLGGDQNLLSVMTKVIYTLLAAPVLYKRLVNDPALIPNAMEELFRLIPLGVVSAFPRIASENVDLPWGFVPVGTALYPDVFAANRDSRVFENPFEIRFDRQSNNHLQFGYGMHSCMGASLARIEIFAVIETLVTRIPTLFLDANANAIPWDSGLILRRPTSLPVGWTNIL